MKHRVLKVILFLLLGVIVYLVVASIWFSWLARLLAPRRAMTPAEVMDHMMQMTAWPWLVVWIAVAWILINWKAMRQSRRKRRGLCPKCAYPIGASDTCTECGRPSGNPESDSRANK